IKAVYHNLNLVNKEIAIIGSLGNSEGYFNDELKKAILKIDPGFNIHESLIEPVVGSAFQAYENAKNN
ncbi:MAG: hypothetical protein K0Q49_2109, partial [Haloplasmataceae bacterium]|nr:hypothetical protein [Haloplasmataceae bacterium]